MKKTNNHINLRFAPSPSGNLHLGSMYIAYLNYLIFKTLKIKNKKKANFFLRIDDSNEKKSESIFIDKIKKDLKNFNIKFNKYILQSTKHTIYFNKAIELVKKDKAYFCICHKKQSPNNKINHKLHECRNKKIKNFQLNKTVIRFKNDYKNKKYIIPTIKNVFIKEISFNTKDIEDFILIRSNKKALSIFAGAIDDIQYNISHIVRAQDWLLSTSKQILLYLVFKKPIPYYIHLNLLKNIDNTKLSKKLKSTSIHSIIFKQHISVEAIKNWFFLIGYKRKHFKNKNQEIFTEKEIINIFNMKNLVINNPKIDINKIKWINKLHLRTKFTVKQIFNKIKFFDTNNILKNSKKTLIFFLIKELKNNSNNIYNIFNNIKIILLMTKNHFKLIQQNLLLFTNNSLETIQKCINIIDKILNKYNNKKLLIYKITNKSHNKKSLFDIIQNKEIIQIFRKIIFINKYSFNVNILAKLLNINYCINYQYLKNTLLFIFKFKKNNSNE